MYRPLARMARLAAGPGGCKRHQPQTARKKPLKALHRIPKEAKVHSMGNLENWKRSGRPTSTKSAKKRNFGKKNRNVSKKKKKPAKTRPHAWWLALTQVAGWALPRSPTLPKAAS